MNIKTVYIEITNRCNLNCRTCYDRSGLLSLLFLHDSRQ